MVRNHPANCVQDPSICGPGQICNRVTEVCEPGPGGGPGGMDAGPALAIDHIHPPRVSSIDGGQMSIEGRGFLGDASVHLAWEGMEAERVSVSDITSHRIMAKAPGGKPGCRPVSVRVTNPDGQSATRNDLFGYFLANVTFSSTGRKLIVDNNNNPSHKSVLSADMNGDGKLDLVTLFTSGINSGVAVFHRGGDGTFQLQWFHMRSTPFTAMAVGQLVGDAAPEVVVASNRLLYIFINNPSPPSPSTLSLSDPITGLALADMNGDGQLELVVSANAHLHVYRNMSHGNSISLMGPSSIAVCPSTSLLVADFDGNHAPDVALACTGQNQVNIVLNPLSNHMTPLNSPSSSSPSSLAAADFDGDGKQDLAVAGGNQIEVFRFQAGNSFRLIQQLSIGNMAPPIRMAAADMDCDLRPDLVYTASGSDLGLFLNRGGGMFRTSPLMTGTVGQGSVENTVGITAGDFDGDGRPDVITSLGTQEVSLFSNIGT